jgi:hypothetical protein
LRGQGGIKITGTAPYGTVLKELPTGLASSVTARIGWDLVTTADQNPFTIITAPAKVNSDGTITFGATIGHTILYDPNVTRIMDEGRMITPDMTLGHELGHGVDSLLGVTASQCAPATRLFYEPFLDPFSNPPYAPNSSEAYAVRFANQIADEIQRVTGKDPGHLKYYGEQ